AYDDGKYIWVTTYGAGVQKFDKVKHTFTGITTKEGLPNDAVYSVIPDDNGKMWIATNNGLAAYNLQTKAIQIFTTQDGLPENEFNGYSGYRSNSGKIFYSTLNGVISINRRIDVSNPYSPNIVFTHFEANHAKKDSIFNCYNTSAIELPPGFNSINIRFAALSFAAPSKNLYKIKLTGYDNDWINLKNNNEVRYTQLPPGRYVFNVMATNNSGKWSSKVLSFKITVLPFWYQTVLFRLLLILIGCAVVYASYRYRVSQLLKVEKMRRRISSDLHDDIGSTLSSINIYSNLAKEEKDNIFYIDTIQQYTQNIIGNLDDLVWSINPKNDGIATMADRMRSFAEPVLAAKGIRCKFTDDVNDHLKLTLEQRNSLFLGYKEMVNNVLKHSKCSNCTINFSTKGKSVSIVVEDDGEGFSVPNLNGKRNGLKNLDYRAKQLKGNFIIKSEDGKGTRAELQIRT
ncbi:MAG: hypothetical protein H0U39_10600, partial [Segetibacter sp.]|nr:hypothetical protein [Segetibacter sp.]